mgnify:FL=1
MRKVLSLFALAILAIACSKPGCTDPIAINYNSQANKDDGSCEYQIDKSIISQNITSDKTLSNDTIWTLQSRVAVESGVTLTIEPGTIIKAVAGTGANASSLIIARGAKIIAQGTPAQPIIFTAESDNIQIGEIYGSSLNPNVRGLWGGIIILGNAPGSFTGNVESFQIDGIPASDINGLYGGTDPNDDSGVFQYVSIRHGGAEIGEGNEINGLTLGCIGNGTIINNVEVVANVDDGIEFFGGTVNADHLLVYAQGDDGIDIDQGYSGKISNSLVALTVASDHALEIDGPEGQMAGSFELDSIVLIGATTNCLPDGVDGEIADYRKGATGISKNIICKDFALSSDVELDKDVDAISYMNGTLIFDNWIIQNPVDDNGNECFGIAIDNLFNDKSTIGSTFEQDAQNFASFTLDAGVDNFIANKFNWTYYSLYY